MSEEEIKRDYRALKFIKSVFESKQVTNRYCSTCFELNGKLTGALGEVGIYIEKQFKMLNNEYEKITETKEN